MEPRLKVKNSVADTGGSAAAAAIRTHGVRPAWPLRDRGRRHRDKDPERVPVAERLVEPAVRNRVVVEPEHVRPQAGDQRKPGDEDARQAAPASITSAPPRRAVTRSACDEREVHERSLDLEDGRLRRRGPDAGERRPARDRGAIPSNTQSCRPSATFRPITSARAVTQASATPLHPHAGGK